MLQVCETTRFPGAGPVKSASRGRKLMRLHLPPRSHAKPLWIVVLISWGIAFFEYALMVPANRIGYAVYSAPQLKGMQEVITLLVFAWFSSWYLGQPLKWNHWAGFALIAVAAWLIFLET